METGGSRNGDRQEGEIAKVVRIPRDWFGPADELVPIGPSAPEAERAPLDPNAFWDGSSSSIQDAVEAPQHGRSDGVPTEHEDAAYPALRRVPRTAAIRWVAASLLVCLVAAASIAGLVLGNSHPRPLKPEVASINMNQAPSVGRRNFYRMAPMVRPARSEHAARGGHPRHSTASSRPSNATEVALRSTSTGQPSPTRTSYGTETSGSGPSTTSPAGNSGAEASAANSNHTAFGAGGALGPMSSPDG